MSACLFCAIAAGDAPAAIVADGGDVLAIMDLRQAEAGHVLVMPRRHARDLYELSPDEAASVMRMAQRVGRAIHDALRPDGLNLWQSNGKAAGQEVFHFHLHVHPRRMGDGLLDVYPGGAPRPASPDRLEALAGVLRQHLRG